MRISLPVCVVSLPFVIRHFLTKAADEFSGGGAELFFLLATPIPLLMRILGKRPLNFKPELNARTYCIPRDRPDPASATMKQHFLSEVEKQPNVVCQRAMGL